MQIKEHTNLMSIFAWVYAGIQAFFVFLFAIFVVLYGAMGVAMAFTAKSSEIAGVIIIAIIVLFFAAIGIFGLVCSIANFQLGRRLRSDTPPTQKRMIVTSILNFVSWMCGGIFLMPFGIALGVYGLWFALSDMGKAYLSGQPYRPTYSYPSPPNNYTVNDPSRRSDSHSDPYRWQ